MRLVKMKGRFNGDDIIVNADMVTFMSNLTCVGKCYTKIHFSEENYVEVEGNIAETYYKLTGKRV